jgi:hypothetical protein
MPKTPAWRETPTLRTLDKVPGIAVLLGALVIAAFSTAWLLLQAPNFFSGYDFLRAHVLYKAYFRDALLAGHLPFWNPFIGLGRPFLADIETATLYPPNYLVVVFGVYGGIALSVLLHQTLAIYGGVRLGRTLGASNGASWLVGAGLALGSPFTGRLAAGMIQAYFVLCWWPILLWLGAVLQDRWSRGAAAGFGAAVALAILGGHPPVLFVEFLGLFVFLAFRQGWPSNPALRRVAVRNLRGLSAVGILGVGLASVQLLPFLELIGQGNRPLHSAGFATSDGLRSLNWLSLIVPASTTFSINWEYNQHCGLVALFAAAGGVFFWRDRNVRALLGLGLLGALFAAGDGTPVLGWVLHFVPGASALRLPSRYGIWLVTGLLGVGAIALSRKPPRPWATVLFVLAAGAAGLVWLTRHMEAAPGAALQFFAGHMAALAGAAILVALWQSRERWPKRAGLIGAGLGVFCAVNWLWAICLQAPIYSRGDTHPDEGAVQSALQGSGLYAANHVPPRLSFDPAEIRENAGMMLGFSAYNSYAAPALDRVWNYLHVAAKVPLSAVDYVQLPREIYERPLDLNSLNLAASLDPSSRSLVIYTKPDPRAYLSFAEEIVPDWRTAEEKMAAGYDFHKTALAEGETAPSLAPSPGVHAAAATITRFDADRISVRTIADAPAILVLAEAWYPGWQATVSGSPTAVFPVNGWMRGVVVPAGASDVVFTFRPRLIAIGSGISALCAALLGVLMLRRKPTSP